MAIAFRMIPHYNTNGFAGSDGVRPSVVIGNKVYIVAADSNFDGSGPGGIKLYVTIDGGISFAELGGEKATVIRAGQVSTCANIATQNDGILHITWKADYNTVAYITYNINTSTWGSIETFSCQYTILDFGITTHGLPHIATTNYIYYKTQGTNYFNSYRLFDSGRTRLAFSNDGRVAYYIFSPNRGESYTGLVTGPTQTWDQVPHRYAYVSGIEAAEDYDMAFKKDGRIYLTHIVNYALKIASWDPTGSDYMVAITRHPAETNISGSSSYKIGATRLYYCLQTDKMLMTFRYRDVFYSCNINPDISFNICEAILGASYWMFMPSKGSSANVPLIYRESNMLLGMYQIHSKVSYRTLKFKHPNGLVNIPVYLATASPLDNNNLRIRVNNETCVIEHCAINDPNASPVRIRIGGIARALKGI